MGRRKITPFFSSHRKRRKKREKSEPPTERECTACHQILPITDFAADKRRKDGVRPQCKSCQEKLAAEKKDEPTEQPPLLEKTCKHCQQTKPITEFIHDKHHKDGHLHLCKDCVKAKNETMRQRWEQERQTLPPAQKTCHRCQQALPAASFGHSRNTKDDLSTYCKECARQRRIETITRYINERAQHPITKIEKTCTSCKRTLPITSFYHITSTKDGHSVYCIDCDLHKQRAFMKKWAHERRKTPVTLRQKTCNICQRTLAVTHFYPYKHYKDGYSPTCKACEKRRRDDYLEQYIKTHDPPTEKQCAHCHQLLAAERFNKNKLSRDGLTYICKACSATQYQHNVARWQKERAKKSQDDFTLFPTFEKECRTCHKTLPLTEFFHKKGSKDGHSSFCRVCDLQKAKDSQERIKARPKNIPTEKTCRHCQKLLPASAFNKSSHRSDGLDSYCKTCRYERSPVPRQARSAEEPPRLGTRIQQAPRGP